MSDKQSSVSSNKSAEVGQLSAETSSDDGSEFMGKKKKKTKAPVEESKSEQLISNAIHSQTLPPPQPLPPGGILPPPPPFKQPKLVEEPKLSKS
jgi:hypothetical protein